MEDIISIPPYPEIHHIHEVPILNRLIYLIKEYKPMFSISIKRQDGNISLRFGDNDGNQHNPIEHQDSKKKEELSKKLITVMSFIKLDKACFFFSEDFRLVDVMLAPNKFVGPGFLNDVFGKQFECQEVKEVSQLDESKLEEILLNKERMFIKPSSFKTVIKDKVLLPLYAKNF